MKNLAHVRIEVQMAFDCDCEYGIKESVEVSLDVQNPTTQDEVIGARDVPRGKETISQ
jgi:hypothetical protein